MFTKISTALAIVLGITSGALAATAHRQHHADDDETRLAMGQILLRARLDAGGRCLQGRPARGAARDHHRHRAGAGAHCRGNGAAALYFL